MSLYMHSYVHCFSHWYIFNCEKLSNVKFARKFHVSIPLYFVVWTINQILRWNASFTTLIIQKGTVLDRTSFRYTLYFIVNITIHWMKLSDLLLYVDQNIPKRGPWKASIHVTTNTTLYENAFRDFIEFYNIL